VARAAFKPRRLRSFFDLVSELLAPQRVAIAMAVLDSALKIGEHSVAVGPVCDIRGAPAGSSGSSGSSDGSRRGSNGAAAVVTWVLALLAAVPGVVSQRLIDAAVGAAADVAGGSSSRAAVLHAADTVLALATVQQELQLQQQQQQQKSQAGSPPAAAEAVTDPQMQLEAAAAVVHCALGDPHSCVESEGLSAAAVGSYGSNGSSGTPRWRLLVTIAGLHVSLLKDLARVWWAYHTRLVLNLGGRG
jgi:hypothetical protein